MQVLAKLEQSRAGYDLLAQLAACSPDDLDTWNSLMQQWTASNAEIVLNELDRRLKLIGRMEKLVENPLADELHDLQPLFARGLWIFGPEYEAVDFRSNRGLAEVIGKFLGGEDYKPPQRRPDFVVLPESSIGAYCADAYDTTGEICGIRKVAILELKKGGFCVTQKEADQARDYSKEIRKAGRVHATTEIVAFVLGATLEEGLGPADYGENKNTHIIPVVYQTVLRKAHQRTFNLQRRLLETQPAGIVDPDVEAVLQANAQQELFDVVGGQPPPASPDGNDKSSAGTCPRGGQVMTPTSVTAPHPEQGQLVSVRARQWVVNDVRPSMLPAPGAQALVQWPSTLAHPLIRRGRRPGRGTASRLGDRAGGQGHREGCPARAGRL